MKEFCIGKNEENKRLDKFLRTVLSKAPDSFIYKMLRKKNIKLNDQKASGNEILNKNDRVTIYLSDETFEKFAGNTNDKLSEYMRAFASIKGVTTAYEDDSIVVMNKPINVLSQKASITDVSLNEWLIGYLLKKGAVDEDSLKTFKPSVLNRLDKNTRGLVIGAKTYEASREVTELIRTKTLRKFYHTTVMGNINQPMVLEGYLSKDESTNKVTIYQTKPENVETSYAKTGLKPIKEYEDRTLLEIELFTGKTHQIRAHLASIGHPILGDPKYGNREFNQKYNMHVQDLTACRLEFPSKCNIDSLNGLVIKI